MELKRIILASYGRRRVVLYPTGGWEIEVHVKGPGWVIDTEADILEPELAAGIANLFTVAAQALTAARGAGDIA